MSVVVWISVLSFLVQCGSLEGQRHLTGHGSGQPAHDEAGSGGHDTGEDEAPEHGAAHGRGEAIDDIAHDTGEEAGEEEEHPGHGAAPHAHGGGHGEEKPSEVATALALALLGAVAWIMSLFYFVNSRDTDIRSATWGVLNVMVSIFLGVLFFKSTKDLSMDFFGEDSGEHGHTQDAKSRALSIARAVGTYLAWNALHYLLMGWPLSRDAVAVLGGHICGFAAIEVFGHVMMLPFFASNAAASLLCVLLSACVISAVFFAADRLRGLVPDQESKPVHEWREQIEENEHDSAGLCLGLLISMVVRSLIVGSLPPVHGAPKSKSHREVWVLLGVASAFGAALIVSVFVTHKYINRPHGERRLLSRLFGVINRTLALTMGWCVLFWGQWFFWLLTGNKGLAQGSRMTARLFMSLAFSGLAFAGIWVVDCIADRIKDEHRGVEIGLRALLEAFGLLMGLAWEACFTSATEGIGELATQSHRHLAECAINLALCAVVAPAWAWYLLPNAEKGDSGSDSLRTVRCPHCNKSFVEPRGETAPSEGGLSDNE